MLDSKIKEIVNKNKRVIVVLKGCSFEKLPRENKYFQFDLGLLDKINVEEVRDQMFESLIENREFTDNYKWMTMEEYLLVKDDLKRINKRKVIVLVNNLYDKQFPYQGTLANIDAIYRQLYYLVESELTDTQKSKLDVISNFYGKIDFSKQSGQYYITFPDTDELPIFELYSAKEKEVVFDHKGLSGSLKRIELSEDELPFLDFELEALQCEDVLKVVFVLSCAKEMLPNKYLVRLSILEELSNINIYFDKLSIKKEDIKNGDQYLEILKKVYKHERFRELEFYKDIQDHSKETVKISQMQIINDIVEQTELALASESFRDIYVTAATGAGKSIMFQIPALYLAQKYKEDKPLTLVISPLIGLMKDQVDSMYEKELHNIATINSETLPFEKDRILDKIKNQEIDILYLSPETLQMKGDITYLIGDRKLGTVIIDEAHIVTTWGKSFRADYWYLGIYLAKLRKQYKFPIITFTATSIYGGKEDMYLDTRNSLNMISPISYFGRVRRDNILMQVRSSKKFLINQGKDYRKTKDYLAFKHLKRAERKNEKSLVYFPTIKLLENFYRFVEQNDPDLVKKTGKFHGKLEKEEKNEVIKRFKTGEIKFVLATKAFGMGIDISDINNVYHYAPTGNVVDYIQEIGRVARDTKKIKCGKGIIDFLPNDLNETKKLYGMSAIRNSQLVEVMQKICTVYKEKGNNRNLIISPEDFDYIFRGNNNKEESTLENKVKTALLMIEKDFSSPNNIGYPPFVARPRQIYKKDLLLVTQELEEKYNNSRLRNFFKKFASLEDGIYTAVYEVDIGKIWERYYREYPFPTFKYMLYQRDSNLKHKNLFEGFKYAWGFRIILGNEIGYKDIMSKYRQILKAFDKFIDECKLTGRKFSSTELGNYLTRELKISNRFKARSLGKALINAMFSIGDRKKIKIIAEASSGIDKQKYQFYQGSEIFSEYVISILQHIIFPENNFSRSEDDRDLTTFFPRSNRQNLNTKLTVLGIGEVVGLFNYQLLGGNDPQIYLRMNSIYPLERAIKKGGKYRNAILEDVRHKHYVSWAMLGYLFTKEQPEKHVEDRIVNYTEWFWNTIEDYFMGIIPEEVREEYSKD